MTLLRVNRIKPFFFFFFCGQAGLFASNVFPVLTGQLQRRKHSWLLWEETTRFYLGFAIKGFGSYLLCLYTYRGSLMTSWRCLLPLTSVYDFLTKTCESYEGVHRISAFRSLPIYFIYFFLDGVLLSGLNLSGTAGPSASASRVFGLLVDLTTQLLSSCLKQLLSYPWKTLWLRGS